MRSSTIVKVYARKKGESDWKDVTAPLWFQQGKEEFMNKITEEDWFLDENEGF